MSYERDQINQVVTRETREAYENNASPLFKINIAGYDSDNKTHWLNLTGDQVLAIADILDPK